MVCMCVSIDSFQIVCVYRLEFHTKMGGLWGEAITHVKVKESKMSKSNKLYKNYGVKPKENELWIKQYKLCKNKDFPLSFI